MDKEKSSELPPNSHFLDIHEVVPEEAEEEEEELQQQEQATKNEEKLDIRPNRIPKVPEMKKQHTNFSRQVSLETGVSVLNKQSKSRNERGVLPRSGNSFAGYGEANRLAVSNDGRRENFNMFRTKSTLGRQNSMLPLRKESGMDHVMKNIDGPDVGNYESINRSVPAGRYFAALTGPELDQVKDFEDILLPKDELWPFLLRFPIGCFGICLGLSSQSILWLNLAKSPATKFLHVTPYINLALWLLALTVLFTVTITYTLKCVFYFEAVKREYFHPVRINFFFAPWVVCMFLAIGAPPILVPGKIHPAVWCVFMAPYFLLELKIYGQWLSGGKRRLSRVANPSSHLSVVGNFVGAILAAKVGWKEPAKFFWAIGFAHYLVLFVTLYQRLPTSEALPKELHPVYSMFIAAPSAASIAWQNIYGEFDEVSRTCYFIALFLYVLLVVRITFFTGFKFSVAWWSYTFPMTTASLATIKYAEAVPCFITKGLALSLSFMSTTMVCVLFVSTLVHAFVWHSLFPNDLAIAITKKKQGKEKKPKETKPPRISYDIRRWAKQSALPFVSALRKNNSDNKAFDAEKEEGYGTT